MDTPDHQSPESGQRRGRAFRLRRDGNWVGVTAVIAMGLTFIALLISGEAREERFRVTRGLLLTPIVLSVLAVLMFASAMHGARKINDVMDRILVCGAFLFAALFFAGTIGNLLKCWW